MKTKILEYFAISVVAFVTLESAWADSYDDFASTYYPQFKSSEYDGTGRRIVLHEFFDEVPAASQSEVLARIMEKASAATPPDNALIESILSLSEGFQDKKVDWNPHLEKLIYAQAKSPDPNVRSLVVHVLAKMRKNDARDLVLSFLNDPDENVRSRALDSIDKWPDAEPLYRGYIQAHQADTDHSKSVQYAKDNLSAINK